MRETSEQAKADEATRLASLFDKDELQRRKANKDPGCCFEQVLEHLASLEKVRLAPERNMIDPNEAQRLDRLKSLFDRRAKEMIRAWVASNGLHCSVNIGMWQGLSSMDEPSAWGILLADVVRHVAGALEEEFGIDKREGQIRIRESFLMELDRPTSKVKGKFLRE